ncbi:protein kinase domain-containing protein [Actinomadura latina]|uniref:non-specific serine/threonine protein kinase n=1 Tax=Actinomadura latina TaxID=163603 RepID=A0A846YXC6_9ACTN|nr:protein kinase [Actinomadura latina]NKZ03244.1 serine/threonine protein kinase [Actinomadura latina]
MSAARPVAASWCVEAWVRVLAGRYELGRELGSGGMGAVYRSVDRDLDRPVAVKVLPEQLARQPGFLARFQRALEHCHAKGVVHRDIKPANIMLDESGSRPVVKVMDFGIARLMSEEATRLTATGMLIGTPAYLSPEQADGKPVGPASDLYSLGCVLFELLTGRPPFTGGTPSGVLMGHLLRTPEAPSALRPGLPVSWDQVVLKALAKDPQERYTSAADMRAALLDALGQAGAAWGGVPQRAMIPAQRVAADDGPPRTVSSSAGTVSMGLPAALARRSRTSSTWRWWDAPPPPSAGGPASPRRRPFSGRHPDGCTCCWGRRSTTASGYGWPCHSCAAWP